MYFTRMIFRANSRKPLQAFLQNSYREHQALWRLFDEDPDAERDFLYRQIFEGGKMKYYVLSKRKPHDKSGIWNIDGPKEYSPRLKKGQRLFFMLRANPVLFSSSGGQKKRHDVVMNAKTAMGYKAMPLSRRPPLQKLVRDSCIQWLRKRAAVNGFSFKEEEVLAEGYRRRRFLRSRSEKPVIYSSVDFQGVLTVSDPDRFKSMLMEGVGKSKAFGCGLMLIKRA